MKVILFSFHNKCSRFFTGLEKQLQIGVFKKCPRTFINHNLIDAM